jgi:hypothetical protein
MVFLLFLVSSVAATGTFLPNVTGPRLVGVKSEEAYDAATKSYVSVMKVGVFALETRSMGGAATWSDAQLPGSCVAATTDAEGQVVVLRKDTKGFAVQHLSPATGWSEPVALPWASEALANLHSHCCPTERVLLTVNGEHAAVLRPDGTGTVFSLSSGAEVRSLKTRIGGAHVFNSTHFVGTLFSESEAAKLHAADDASAAQYPLPRKVDDESGESGKVVFLEWESGKVTETAARVTPAMQQLIAVEGRVYTHHRSGNNFHLYSVPLDGTPSESVMMTGRLALGTFVVTGPRIAFVKYSGYVDGIEVWNVDAKRASMSSFSSIGDVKPVAVLWD